MSDLNDVDRDSAQRILTAGRHLLALISELLDTALVETGELKMYLQTVDVVAIAGDVAALLRPLAAANDITVEVRAAERALTVHADDLRLRQVIVNFASNAIKYNRRGGVVTLDCARAGLDKIHVAVRDTGPGLSPEELTRVFTPFDRLAAERGGVEGTGIGLPLARGLAEAMGGTLAVESVLGRGSTFTVTLPRAAPLVADQSAPPEPATTRTPREAGRGERDTPTVVSIEEGPAKSEEGRAKRASCLGERPT